MKIWNTPEMQELDISLTASGAKPGTTEDKGTGWTLLPWIDHDTGTYPLTGRS